MLQSLHYVILVPRNWNFFWLSVTIDDYSKTDISWSQGSSDLLFIQVTHILSPTSCDPLSLPRVIPEKRISSNS